MSDLEDPDLSEQPYGDESSEGETLQAEGQKSKKPKKQKSESAFATYDEFAHLLDEDSDEAANQKYLKNLGKRKVYEDRNTMFQKGGWRGRGGNKRARR